MDNNLEYIYSFHNTSCTLRVVEHLHHKYRAYLDSAAVINSIDRWLVKLSIKKSTPDQAIKNLQAFLDEMGFAYQPSSKIRLALDSLDRGESATEVMNRYQVVIVTYGKPEIEEIEIFRDRVVEGLGYCPQNLA